MLTPTLGIVGLKFLTLCNHKKLNYKLGEAFGLPLFYFINTNMPLIIKLRELVLVNVNYWLPDYENVLQEFIWQTEDVVPEIPKVHNFLNFWHNNIDAVINEVYISTTSHNKFNHTDYIKEI